MAVASLHNASGFGAFFGESQSSVSSDWDDQTTIRPSARASSLLHMWRELEGNCMVNNSRGSRRQSNASDSECLSSSMSVGRGSDNGHDGAEDTEETDNERVRASEMEKEDSNSIISEQSRDMGGIERDRVRQIFREWMNNGSVDHSSSGLQLNHHPRSEWLGENDCERVRVIREWVQMNAQQRNNQGSIREGVAEVALPIEQVRDGLVITRPEIGPRRPIQRLLGRQTLLDLLLRFQCERKAELQGLLEQRPVSDFTHRNRIQAHLRGRFLRNETFIQEKRPPSGAANELGLLRQRNTVSGLREEFLSKLDSSASTSVSSAAQDTNSNDANDGELESTCREGDSPRIHTLSGPDSAPDPNSRQHELAVQVAEVSDLMLYNDRTEQEAPLDFETAAHTREEQVLDSDPTDEESSVSPDNVGTVHGEEINTAVTNELMLETEDTGNIIRHEVFHEHYESRSTANYAHEVTSQSTDLEQGIYEQVDEYQESITEIEDGTWQQLNRVEFAGSIEGSREEMDRSWEDISSNQLFEETSYNNEAEHFSTQEPHEEWQGNNLQEAIDSWLDMPSAQVGTSPQIHTYNFPDDDDNSQSMELRELFSRRRVSSLLRSGFRDSLDQVLQSHVERLGHVLENWELDNASSPSRAEQDQEQQNVDRAFSPTDENNPSVSASTLVSAFQRLWDGRLQSETLPHNDSDQQLGTDWELINELRIDMARLQQRMSNMQSMLEACIDMQIELQRSVKQEVSAALNRSIFPTDAAASKYEEISWDYVRKGICCLCCNSKINSLLYRCGHMCSCLKCADKLVEDKGKCPMCQAPVVEAVRAYFTQ